MIFVYSKVQIKISMKKNSSVAAMLMVTIAFCLGSCMNQSFPQYSGHYHPKTNEKKKFASIPFTHHEKVIISLPVKSICNLKSVYAKNVSAQVLNKNFNLGFKEKVALHILKNKMNANEFGIGDNYASIPKKKSLIKKYSSIAEEKNVGMNSSLADEDELLEVIIAILLPPVAVYLHEDEIGDHFWIDLLLTILFYLPGIIYALYIVLST
jgi:uncharacterized membrane protein YqaE (UPF0057 family)